MRFLHGSVTEFVHDAHSWDIARKAAPAPGLDEVAKELDGLQKDDLHKDDSIWEGRIRPSDFALWATKHQKPINDNSAEFNLWMDEWQKWEKKVSPDVVILTQGWSGVPASTDVEIVRTIIKGNPETLFIWAPLYVTDRTFERYNSYVESGIFHLSEPNLRMVDLWDLAKAIPKPTSGKGLDHITAGGQHMIKSMSRIWNEVNLCTAGVAKRTGNHTKRK
ncbi:hypothetical protein ACHAXR_007040 [Thalassiosira sp. AJA248-18]